jgi:hypothetical protein
MTKSGCCNGDEFRRREDLPSRRAVTASRSPFKENIVFGFLAVFTLFAAWLTHIFTCFSQGLWGFLIAGAIMFPIGIFHGIYLWFQ